MNWTHFSQFKVTLAMQNNLFVEFSASLSMVRKINTHPIFFLYFIKTALGKRHQQPRHPIYTQPIKNRINIKYTIWKT